MKDKLAIVGCATQTRDDVNYSDPNLDIWVFNEAAQHPWCKRADAVLQLHHESIWRSPINRGNVNHVHWLQDKPGTCGACDGKGKIGEKPCEPCGGTGVYTPPESRKAVTVYMWEQYPDVPNAVKYPLQEIVAALLPNFSVDSERARKDYFTSTIAYAVALGTYLGYKEIHTYGVELADEEEYRRQLPCANFWTGIAIGRGVQWVSHSQMFDAPLYPLETFIGLDKAIFTKRLAELTPPRNAAQNEYREVKAKYETALKRYEEGGAEEAKAELLAAIQARLDAANKFGILDGDIQECERWIGRAQVMEKATGDYVFSKHEFERDLNAIGAKRDLLQIELNKKGAAVEKLLGEIAPKLFDSKRRHQFDDLRKVVDAAQVDATYIGGYTGGMNANATFIKALEAERSKQFGSSSQPAEVCCGNN